METDSISEGGRVNLVYDQAMSDIKPELPNDSDTETGIIDHTVTRVQNDDDELPSNCNDGNPSQLISGNSDRSPTKAAEKEICGRGKNKGKKGYCTKDAKHKGKCNSEGFYSKFYELSESGIASKRRREAEESYAEDNAVFAAPISNRYQRANNEAGQQNQNGAAVKVTLNQAELRHVRRNTNPTDLNMISDRSNSTRFKRKTQTKQILNVIHGGEHGAIYGAFYFLQTAASRETMDQLITNYKNGQFLQNKPDEVTKKFETGDIALRQAIVVKYQNMLSRRKYDYISKTCQSFYDPDKETWLPRNEKINGVKFHTAKLASHKRIENFVNALDIGDVYHIPGHVGMVRPLTSLIVMITDLHLGQPHLCKDLIWFNNIKNHFVVEFSDDGAPETKELTMSVGTLTFWNFGRQIRRRDYHYLLHAASENEKSEIVEDLWDQHCLEMETMEGCQFTIHGQSVSFEFHPSADQSWISWAANEVNQAASYPSPFGNVTLASLHQVNGTFGTSSTNTWQVWSEDVRTKNVEDALKERERLKKSGLSEDKQHSKLLEFIRESGSRSLGKPRIRRFVNRLRPEPMHAEHNIWLNTLDVIYNEAKSRGCFSQFLEVLKSHQQNYAEQVQPMHQQVEKAQANAANSDTDLGMLSVLQKIKERSLLREAARENILGVGLPAVAARVKEHHEASNNYKKLSSSVRLIGEQAISLARFSFRLVDTLEIDNEKASQRIVRLVLSRLVQMLRDMGKIFNNFSADRSDLDRLKLLAQRFYNLHVMFLGPESTNVGVWTVCYPIVYHAVELFEKFGIGYGILSAQGKESNNKKRKEELDLTNRSRCTEGETKWKQVFTQDFVKSFYIPKHEPQPSRYKPHFLSRIPDMCNSDGHCECGRKLVAMDKSLPSMLTCNVCNDEFMEFVDLSAESGEIHEYITEVFFPFVCAECIEIQRFAPHELLNQHYDNIHRPAQNPQFSDQPLQNQPTVHKAANVRSSATAINPHALTVKQLKEELTKRGIDYSSARKNELIALLENELTR